MSRPWYGTRRVTDWAAFALAMVACAALAWVVVWSVLSALDEGHCLAHDAEYVTTSKITMVGYCRVDGVVVAAEGVGR